MKKVILIGLATMLAPVAILAQGGVGFGIKAGANFAHQAVEGLLLEGTKIKSEADFHVGAYLNLNFSEKFGITPEVLFTGYATKWDDIRVDYDYIALPVMLRFRPVPVVFLEAGPQFSFLTKAEVEGLGDVKDQLKNNDFGLAFGAGLQVPVGLNFGARYVLGFTNISDVSDESIKNRTFQVYLGWTLFGAK